MSDQTYDLDVISPQQIRAARALLEWEQVDLAQASGVSKSSVQRTESGSDPRVSTLARIQSALESAGIRFIGPDDGGEVGVILRR